jgi:TRAP-type C4-dicarboxylate transport system substrate-binding protein
VAAPFGWATETGGQFRFLTLEETSHETTHLPEVHAAAAAALACTPWPARPDRAYKAEYKMSLVVGTAFPWGKGGEIWANLVKERTQGRINIKQYPGVSLVQGDQTREFSAIRQGVIDMASDRPSTGRRRSRSSTCSRCPS